ncbi:MAG: P-II family nitrogen regulator [Candidatus Puniceispirillales bacterium]
MKYLVAIIQPSRLEPVQEGLSSLGISGMTVSEVRGYGRQRGKTEIYRGAEYSIDFLPKIKLEIALEDGTADKAVEFIKDTCHTGRIGDGKVFVMPLDDVTRIRTGEIGQSAL